MSSDLFREEVLNAHSKQAYGEVMLVHPTSHFLLAALGAALLLNISLFLAFGHYTSHANVSGVLEPVDGVVKLYASRNGQLMVSHVHEGQIVHKGDILLEFASEHNNVGGTAIEGQSETHTRERLDTLQQELHKTLEISTSDEASARESLSALRNTHENLVAQIKNQSAHVNAARMVVSKYEDLQKAGFMPELQVQDKRNDLTEQQVRLQTMEKDLISNDADIARTNRIISSTPLRTAVTKAQIERNIASAEAELAVQTTEHDWSVIASRDGAVSALAVKVGQNVDPNTPLLTLVPQTGELRATLYATSRNLGFVKIGQTVKMKLDAFPYQKFGLTTGKVVMVADSPILLNEMSPATRLYANGEKSEPLYAINVALDSQTIDAYGQAQILRPGMQLAADVELDTRTIFEWMLEPLLSMKKV